MADLTPRRLLELLQALPESALDLPMGAYYDAECAWGHLPDLGELPIEDKNGYRVMLVVE